MIFNKFSSVKGFALLLYVVVTIIVLCLLIDGGSTSGIIAGLLNTACNGFVICKAYRKFNTNNNY